MNVLTCKKEKPGMNVLTCEKEKPGMNVLTYEKEKPGVVELQYEKSRPSNRTPLTGICGVPSLIISRSSHPPHFLPLVQLIVHTS